VDYEAELGVVIGTTARRVSAEGAYAYVAGYTCLNDVSARDLQFGDKQWVRGKSLDTFCPMGPWLVTRDELPDPHTLAIRCSVNGELLQDSNTSELIFGVPELVSFLSHAFTLLPGDVIATGTPSGVGVFRKPPRFLKDGDAVVVEIEGIGRLENSCRTLG
jgi:2-keto-4-pentenoate hydratase/2-oxohepta-3-ene-1,7-dioic acid hydratase in catechol pathway